MVGGRLHQASTQCLLLYGISFASSGWRTVYYSMRQLNSLKRLTADRGNHITLVHACSRDGESVANVIRKPEPPFCTGSESLSDQEQTQTGRFTSPSAHAFYSTVHWQHLETNLQLFPDAPMRALVSFSELPTDKQYMKEFEFEVLELMLLFIIHDRNCPATDASYSDLLRNNFLSPVAMSADPYDFEIAIPATPSNASRTARKQYSPIDSDEDASDASGSLSNISSDNDTEQASDHEVQQRRELNFKRPLNEPRTAAPSTGSALDKAKSFLSKYSGATTGDPKGSSSRSRRISLDLDDDDEFSMESSGEGATNKKVAPMISTSVASRDSKPPQPSKGYGFIPNPDEAKLNRFGALHGVNEDENSQSSDDHPAYSTTQRASTASVARHESESDKSQVGDSIESFHSGASGEQFNTLTAAATAVATQPKSAFQEESADDYNDSFQEESLSQSIVADSRPRDTQPSPAAPVFNLVKTQQSIASESGVYEEEVFEEEDSAVAVPATATAVKPTVNTDKSFDYSMDFSDNEVEVQVQVQTIKRPGSPGPCVKSSQSDHDEEQSVLLNSESFEAVEHGNRTIGVTDITSAALSVAQAVEQLTKDEVSLDNSTRVSEQTSERSGVHEQARSEHDSSSDSLDKEGDQQPPTHKIVGTPPITTAAIQKASSVATGSASEVMKATQRPHIAIVRAFELDEEKHVEMKDASTQFTGNHAAIQADLIPDGMHNLFVPPPMASARTNSRSFDRENEVPSCDARPVPCQSEQQPPPPPPKSPQLGSSMDALKLPMTTTTSIYRQQLLALQEQILQKKRETARIVHDRMAFQYSSLQGTERFIASRRAQNLELWEALMRVDPTLDERKAREVARLAQATST